MSKYCDSSKFFKDSEGKSQLVRCVRNDGHVGIHQGVLYQEDGSVEFVLWN